MSDCFDIELYVFAKTREELLDLFGKFDITFEGYPHVCAPGHVHVQFNPYESTVSFDISYEPWNGYYVLNCSAYKAHRVFLRGPVLEGFLNDSGFEWAVIVLSESDQDDFGPSTGVQHTRDDFTFSPSFSLDKSCFDGFAYTEAQRGHVLTELDCENLYFFVSSA